MLKKNEKAINNGYKIYRVDCLKSDFIYIKDNIIKTLGNVLYLDNIDWNNVYINSCKSIVKEVCDYKKNNPDKKVSEIAPIFNLSTTTIIRYLKSGNNFGWCKYDAQLEIEKSWTSECKIGRIHPTLQRGEILQYDMDGKFIKEWSCRNEICKQEGYYSSSITRCCLGKNKFAHGYMWFFKDGFKYEFVE